MVENVKFVAAFGNEDRVIELSAPNGGGSTYHIMVDGYYWGKIANMQGGWRVLFQLEHSEFNAGDLQELIDHVISVEDQERAIT